MMVLGIADKFTLAIHVGYLHLNGRNQSADLKASLLWSEFLLIAGFSGEKALNKHKIHEEYVKYQGIRIDKFRKL